MKRRKPRPQSDHIELSPAGELQSCRRSPVFPDDLGGKASNASVWWRQPVWQWQDVVNASSLPKSRRESPSAQACLQALPRAIADSALPTGSKTDMLDD